MATEPPELVPLRSPIRRDLQTSNPRKLFRMLKNQCTDLGYDVTDELHIEDDPVGELGFVDGTLGAEKHLEDEIRSSPVQLPLPGDRSIYVHQLMLALAAVSLLLGIGSVYLGSVGSGTGLLLISILTGIGWIITKPTAVTERAKFALLIEVQGELYKREEANQQVAQTSIRETNLTSELTVTITPSLSDPEELLHPDDRTHTFTNEVKQLIELTSSPR